VIQNPGFLPDYPQNLITCSLCYAKHTLIISERSVHNFLSYLANTQTDRQTKTGKNNLLGGGNQPIISQLSDADNQLIIGQCFVSSSLVLSARLHLNICIGPVTIADRFGVVSCILLLSSG